MPFNSQIDRTDASALIPEDASREIWKAAIQSSSVMDLARKLPDMPRKQRRMPVLSALPIAYFVDGDTGLKQTSEVNWDNVYLNAEEIAVIVPIPEAVLDDADYDIWGEVTPLCAQAIGKVFDQAILFGTNAPTAWPDDILAGAVAASQTVDLSTVEGASGDIYDALMGVDGTIAMVEEDGFAVNGHVASLSTRAKLRGLRNSDGVPIFHTALAGRQDVQATSRYELDGERIIFPRNGSMIPASALMFSGDWSQLVWSVRQDLTYKLLDQAVIQDGSGNIVYNLAQQDMVAMRLVFRAAWALPNPINPVNETAATRYPFAVLVP